MDNDLQSFFDAAKQICLTDTEHSAARGVLTEKVTELEVHLTQAEREEVRTALLQHITTVQPEQHFGTAARDMHLHSSEKEMAFNRIQAFMKMNPVREEERVSFLSRLNSIREVLLRPFTLRAFPAQLVVVSLLVTTGGGFAYAAEDALPGDTLYPLKVEVTEPLREYLTFSEERRTERALHHLNRRFEEAQRLLELEEIDPSHRAVLEERIEERMTHMEERLQRLSEHNAEFASDMGEKWEFAVEDHGPVLQKFIAHGRETDGNFPAFARVRDWRERAFRSRHSMEERAARRVSPEDMQQVLQVHLESMQQVRTSPVVDSEVAEYLRESMEEAQHLLEQGNAPEAFQAMRRGKRAVHRTMEGRQFLPEQRGDTSVFEHMRPPPPGKDMFKNPFESSRRGKNNNEGIENRQGGDEDRRSPPHISPLESTPFLSRPPVRGGPGKQALRPPFGARSAQDLEDGYGRKEREHEAGRGRGGPLR